MNTKQNAASLADVQQHDYFQKFLLGQNLIDSSSSFARLNSKTVTEKSLRESFQDEQNYEVILQQVMASNIRLMDEITKCQENLQSQVQQLQRTNQELSIQNERLQDSNAKLLHELDNCKKEKQLLLEQIKQFERENKKVYLCGIKLKQDNKMDLNKILVNKTESSFLFYKNHMLSSKFVNPKSHNSNPFIYTSRPQSPSTSIRQCTPTKTKTDIKLPLKVFNNNTYSWRECQQNKNYDEYIKFKQTIEQLMKKSKKLNQ